MVWRGTKARRHEGTKEFGRRRAGGSHGCSRGGGDLGRGNPGGGWGADGAQAADGVRFSFIDVFIDSGETPLTAYQFELKATVGDVKIVGIERGGCQGGLPIRPITTRPAMMGGRIIVGAFNTGDDLPAGKVRVARLHVRIGGAVRPEYAGQPRGGRRQGWYSDQRDCERCGRSWGNEVDYWNRLGIGRSGADVPFRRS